MKTKEPVHPGEFLLEEYLIPMGVSQKSFAAKIGWSPSQLTEFIKGKRKLSLDSALDLAKELEDTSAELWMRVQADWEEHHRQHERH